MKNTDYQQAKTEYNRALKFIEGLIVLILVSLMTFILVFTTVDLVVLIVKEMVTPPKFLISIGKLQEMLGLVMLILIGIELLESIKTYLSEQRLHVEVVLMVAIIAVSRKVIILNIKETSANVLVAIASIILALSLGYYLVKRARLDEEKMLQK